MADSDIQFLGNWNAQHASTDAAFISAIVLTPSDGTAPRTFSRTQTSLIHVGRIPAQDASDNAERPSSEESARYTNPVMSRNHAKITFADSGTVYIIDTASHHGTWVCRTSSTNPDIKLTSESPYMLLDGDKIIFGKEVTKAGIKYQPLSVSIKLLRTNANVVTGGREGGDPNVSPLISSPKPAKRYGLRAYYSDADSSGNEGTTDEPCIDSNSKCLEVLSNPVPVGATKSSELGDRIIAIDSSTSQSSSSATSSPSSVGNISTTPLHSPTHNHSDSVGILSLFSSRSRDSSRVQLPGLELLGMPSQPENAAPTSVIQSVTPSTPPWRRASALFSTGSMLSAVTGPPKPQRRIGRLLNPLWMRSMRAATGDDGPMVLSESSAQRHNARITYSSVGIHGRHREREHEGSEGEHTRQRHGESRERSGHQSGRIWRTHGRLAGAEPMDEDEPTTQNMQAATSARYEELAQQLATVQDTIRTLGHNKPEGELPATLKSTLTALETALAALREDFTTVKVDIAAGNVDSNVLRVDLATLRTGYNADITAVHEKARVHAAELALLRGEVNSLRADVSRFEPSVDKVVGEAIVLRSGQDGIRSEVERLHGELATVQDTLAKVVDASGKISRDLQGTEESIMRKVREEILRVSRDRDAESPSLEGKRKRGHDEAFPSGSDTSATLVTPSTPRPSKRLRTVADFAAASVIGAFGAYVGLAYLQL